ncbi:hypothetical protein FGSG_10495 [Fusarium graminearum PH-1]|uniref:Uncharacterized protein n=2 Tax=Gibberella zeae TaxID=5518 RepID=I1S195_GIBZE|nr:hypothetical protein FGSG_10495 [Fusarium graminearum PH-1]ESU17221.1 hypothetical protein FGSG_10495 [Fusarium graminearum PH-1]PCD18541.1 hypothetical protein FGRA07_06294 [Fusarium graminearum]CAG1999601.1 unnamed protein product [Fusarium graminearum]|eukprot:XP_011319483.1 hypothetical protein FGSG_10495 [Fusarium graminearum PH-1]
MRFALFCLIALGANTAIASVCKPRQSSETSVVMVEATTVTVSESGSPTSTKLVRTGGTTSATIITTSDIAVTTTTEFSTSTATLTSEDTTTADSVTTVLSSASTETTTLTETTTTATPPLETFQIIAPEHNFHDEYLIGRKITSQVMGFDLEPQSNIPTLTFSIEAESSFVCEIDGMYLCIEYASPSSPGQLQLCNKDSLGNGRWSLLTCEKTDEHGLECSVPAATCGFNMNTGQVVCNDLEGDFTQFYLVGNGSQNGFTLALGSREHPPSSDYYTAVEIEVTSVRDEL